MITSHTYVRKPFLVEAIRVTEENFDDVCVWCQGTARNDDGKYIKVRVLRALGENQTKARVGDWILYAGKGYKVYTHVAFHAAFELLSLRSVDA
jgi:hypothetical protein